MQLHSLHAASSGMLHLEPFLCLQAGITSGDSPADCYLNTLHDLPAVLAEHCFGTQPPPAVEQPQHQNGADLLACPA